MNCNDAQKRLDALLNGTLPTRERFGVQAHLNGCDECGQMLILLRLDGKQAPDLTASILAQTVGDPCEQSRDQLCDLIDLRLESMDRQLMRSHLEHCDDCDTLSNAMLRLKMDLPAMAELEVPAKLTASILQATSGSAGAVGWADRLTGWAEKIWVRPRLAWEAGYLGATLLWFFVSVSGADLQASLPRATDGTTQTVQKWTQSAGHLGKWAWDWTGTQSTTAIDTIKSDIEPTIGKVGGSFEQTLKQISGEARRSWTRLTVNDENESETEGEKDDRN
jgi:anti-sigma factor RsiW